MQQFISSYSIEDLKQIFAELLEEKLKVISTQKELAPIDNRVRFYTIDEVCKELHLCKTTLHAHIKGGLIKSTKVGRRRLFTQSDIDTFVNGGYNV